MPADVPVLYPCHNSAAPAADCNRCQPISRPCLPPFTAPCPAGVSQWSRPEGGSFSAPFVPAATFTGAQPGYHFTMGPKGLGYYREAAAASFPGSLGEAGAAAAAQHASRACSSLTSSAVVLRGALTHVTASCKSARSQPGKRSPVNTFVDLSCRGTPVDFLTCCRLCTELTKGAAMVFVLRFTHLP